VDESSDVAEPRTRSNRVRVLVLTAPVGEGHVAAARALSEEILRRNPSAEIQIVNALSAFPALLRWVVSDAYRWQLRAAPWLFGVLFGALRRSALLRRLIRAGLSLAGSRRLLQVLRLSPSDVIVSTWPVATTILGCLRLRGKVPAPVCATITDFAGLELWVDKGVDLHLVMHESLVPKVERLAGRDSARHVSLLVAGEFLAPRSSADARRALDLPETGVVVVVSGGGWAVGDLSGAVATGLRLADSTVLCLAGRDDETRARLLRAFAGEPRVRVLGFTDRMNDLLAAADVLVHSTGGVTSLEALARGCPVVAYGAPHGHSPLLAREMASLGLVSHARSTNELESALRAPTRLRRDIDLAVGVDAASLVLSLRPRIVAPLRSRLARPAAMAASAAALMFAFFASDLTYPVVAEALALPDTTSISTDTHSVALVIRGRPRNLLALTGVARRLHLRASVAVTGPVSTREVQSLRRSGFDPIPELRGQGVSSWFEASHQVDEQRSRYGLDRSFYYLAPHEGFTLTDYLLARRLGGKPVQGHEIDLTDPSEAVLRPGTIVIATVAPDRTPIRAALIATIRRIERTGLAVTSVQRLAAHSAGP
jgi:processive 1,2-diacylglycerol beta-glucosyltransferase